MNGHIGHADLRAYLDHELAPEAQSAAEQHLAGCPDCRVRLAAVAERAQRVGSRLASLEPQAAEAPRPVTVVLSQFEQKQLQRKDDSPMFKKILSKRPVWAGLSVVAVLAVAFSFAPVQAWAGEFLSIFRVQQVTVLPIDVSQLSALSDNASLAQEFSQLFSNSVNVTRQPGQPVVEPSAAAASKDAGFNVRLLSAGQGTPRLTEQSGSAFDLTINRQRAQALLNEAGRSDLQLPASVDGAKISVDIPAAVTAAYGDCPTPSTKDSGSGLMPRGVDAYAPNCTVLAQLPSPTVDTPPDLNVGQLAEIGLEFTGMSASEAQQVSRSVDWTTTLVIPFPSDAGTSQQVSVDGVSGTLILSHAGRGGQANHYALIWVKNGIIYALTGTGSADQATTLANSIH